MLVFSIACSNTGKKAITGADVTETMVYTGTKLIPKVVVYAGSDILLPGDYVKNGEWLAEEPGEHTFVVLGRGDFKGREICTWEIVQGNAQIGSVAYQNGNIMVDMTTPYVNGKMEITVAGEDGSVVAKKTYLGTFPSGGRQAMAEKVTMKPGRYTVKVVCTSQASEINSIKAIATTMRKFEVGK